MKYLIFILFVLITIQSRAQKGIEGLINAEKSFAAYAISNGTKNAFLKFMDSAAIVYDKGEPVNAMKTWTAKEPVNGILNWQPAYSEISASGEFGYNAGPWTFQPSSIHDSIVARGMFFTIWHLNDQGEWKFLLDLGNNKAPVFTGTGVQIIDAPKSSTDNSMTMYDAEKKFISSYQTNPSMAYAEFLSTQSILNRDGYLPATSRTDQRSMIASTPLAMDYTPVGAGIALSHDLGYVYGTVTNQGKKHGYFRVWRHEESGWKIALEVLHY